MSDIFTNLLPDFWNELLSFAPIRVFLPHLSILVHQTWPIALIGWIGVRLLIRSTGRVLHLGEDVLLFGMYWTIAMVLYAQLGLEGSAIVHALSFSLLVLGCVVRFITTVSSSSPNRRSSGN